MHILPRQYLLLQIVNVRTDYLLVLHHLFRYIVERVPSSSLPIAELIRSVTKTGFCVRARHCDSDRNSFS